MKALLVKAFMLLPVDSPDPIYVRKFQQLVGALMWLCRIRVDLLFCVNLFAFFSEKIYFKNTSQLGGRARRAVR